MSRNRSLEARQGVLPRLAIEAPARALPPRLHALPALERPPGDRGAASDGALVVRALDGDEGAVEQLFRRHAPFVLNLATRLLRDRTEADDIVQEAFEITLTNLESIRTPTAFKGWLVQVAVRQVHRRFRKRKLMRALGFVRPGTAGEPVSLDALASSDATSEERSELALLDRALAGLGAEDRIPWMLRYVEGLSIDEVAEACACSPATAKRRIARAREVVAKHVGIDGSGGDDV